MNKISIVGCGRLGLAFSLLCESAGYEVSGCDNRVYYVQELNNKTLKTPEPHIEELLRVSSNFKATTNSWYTFDFSDLIFVFVPTPSKPNGEYDHQHIEEVVQDLVSYHLDGGEIKNKTLVICCTVMPTYCKDLQERLVKYGYGVNVVYNPEFVAQGLLIQGLQNSDIVLIGCDPDYNLLTLKEVYQQIMKVKPEFKTLSYTSAEIAKIAINCYLNTKISYANMIGQIAIKSGEQGSVKDILDAIGSDSRIGKKYFNYGFGFGGVCLPRDGTALGIYAERVGASSLFPDLTDEFNEEHFTFIKEQFIQANPDKSVPFIFNQLGYKKGVEILTESQHYRLCKEFLYEGYSVNIIESELVINAVKPELEMYGNRVTYGNGIGTNSKFENRLIEGQKKKGIVVEL